MEANKMAWTKLKTRLLSAAVLIAALLIVTFAPMNVFMLALWAVCFVVLREALVTFRQDKKLSVMITNFVFACLYMLSSYINKEYEISFYMITVLYAMTLLIISVLDNKNVKFSDVCVSLFSVIYSVVFLIHLSFIRRMDNGVALMFLAFIGAFLPDTTAYFAGNLFGKHKLIEEISPNKTVEGAIGGVAGSIIFFLIYGGILTYIGFNVNFIRMFILSVVCGVISQFGDLSASHMKRTYGVKDFGKLIPGHGGLLDRIDSLIFVIPVVYYFIKYFPII